MPDAETHQCQWLDCTTVFPDAESLYEHITSLHIGRKASGTLSLACHWAGCTSKATKRDHLTSHTRVHIDLKPHTCEICSKSFKRPQDLKKHEKIHTEEHHAHHKHSKAVTINGAPTPPAASSGAGQPPATAATTAAAANASAAAAYNDKLMQSSYAAGFPPFPGFPYFQHPMFGGHPGMAQLDLAQLIEHQRQMNAHVVNAAYGLPPGYGMPSFPPPGTFPAGLSHSQGLPALPMFTNSLPSPYPYPFYHPSQHTLQLPPQPPLPQGNQTLNPQAGAPAPAQATGLYPSLGGLGSMYPTLSPAPAPPSAQQAKPDERDDASYSPHSPASTLSPKVVPSLSPASASNGYSPSPEQDHESLFGRPTNAVAGQKRAFEAAAGDFFDDLKSKRVHDDDYKSQVENIDALALLLTPQDFAAPSMQRPVHSSPTSHAEYNPADVDHINDILANLAQNINELDRTGPVSSNASNYSESLARSHAHHHAQQHASQPHQQQAGMGMYPSLSTYDRPLAPLPARHSHASYHDAQSNPSHASVRLSKTPAAPSIAPNETRHANYIHMERLTKAALPPLSSIRSSHLHSMDVDGADDFSRPWSGKGYAASVRSTSLDSETGPTLPPIKATPVSAPTTLPHLRDMLDFTSREETHPAEPLATSSPASSSSATAGSTRHGLYPSLIATASPAAGSAASSPAPSSPGLSAAGGMERLVPRFTKMVMRSENDEPAAVDDQAEAFSDEPDEMDADADADADQHTIVSKKSRVEPDAPAPATAEVKARRLAVLRALVVHLNDAFRTQMARKIVQDLAAASASASAAAASPAAVAS